MKLASDLTAVEHIDDALSRRPTRFVVSLMVLAQIGEVGLDIIHVS